MCGGGGGGVVVYAKFIENCIGVGEEESNLMNVKEVRLYVVFIDRLSGLSNHERACNILQI